MRIGVIDTGVNPWHSHVRGAVDGCRIYVASGGEIREDGDFSDPIGHGTAVAGVLRETLPGAELYAVRVFEQGPVTYPSVVARGILRAAAAGCRIINLSLALDAQDSSGILRDACAAASKAGCVLVAAGHPERPDLLPAALPGVWGVIADSRLGACEVRWDAEGPYRGRAPGVPRDLDGLPREWNLWGHSFACARFAAFLAREGRKPHQADRDLKRCTDRVHLP